MHLALITVAIVLNFSVSMALSESYSEENFEDLLSRAQLGISESQAKLAWEYIYGFKVRPDVSKANFWIDLLEDGHEKDILRGNLLTNTFGIRTKESVKNYKEGRLLLEKNLHLRDPRVILKLSSLRHLDNALSTDNAFTEDHVTLETLDLLGNLVLEKHNLASHFYITVAEVLSNEAYTKLEEDGLLEEAWQNLIDHHRTNGSGMSAFLAAELIKSREYEGYEKDYREALETAAAAPLEDAAKFLAVTELSVSKEYYPPHSIQAIEYFLRSVESLDFPIQYFENLGDDFFQWVLPEKIRDLWLAKFSNFLFSGYSPKSDAAQAALLRNAKLTNEISVDDLIIETRSLIKSWKASGVIIHPYDLCEEAIIQFLGKRGKINETLAEMLAKKAIRSARIIEDEWAENYGKRILSLITQTAANQLIRSPKIGKKMLLDELTSTDLVTLNDAIYTSYLTLENVSLNLLEDSLRRYKELSGETHLVSRLMKNAPSAEASPTNRDKIYERLYALEPSPELAYFIANHYEFAQADSYVVKAIKWYKIAHSDQRKKVDAEIYSDDQWVNLSLDYIDTELDLLDIIQDRLNRLAMIESKNFVVDAKLDFVTFYDVYPAFNTVDIFDPYLDETNDNSVSKIALVIGNSDYFNDPLPSALNDSFDIRTLLVGQGFEVIYRENLKSTDLNDLLEDFGVRSQGANLAVVYFAGHGIQASQSNYLLPVDIELSSTIEEITQKSIKVDQLMRRHINGKSKLILIDACRSLPREILKLEGVRNGGGIASKTPRGLVVSFATLPEEVAVDGGVANRNSPYTSALLEKLIPGEDLMISLRKIRKHVLSATGGRQEPVFYGSFTEEEVLLD